MVSPTSYLDWLWFELIDELLKTGKDTLMKMRSLAFNSALFFWGPIVESLEINKSHTSGDIDLYTDSETAYSPLPILDVDYEGLEGGETAKQRWDSIWGTTRLFESWPQELTLLTQRSSE